MDAGTIIIISMASVTVGSGVTQKILTSLGKVDEAQYLDLAIKSGLAITGLSVFIKFIGVVRSLG